ncbi:MAG: helix-turn-helix transcriptional regulator [Thermoproteus sp.]
MIVLNLTLPPLLVIFLGAASLSNISLPARPASAVAAFWLNNTPIPCWVLQDRLYVLQDGEPAYVEYVPQFLNKSGIYSVSINAPDGAVIAIPPGVIAELSPSNYTLISINTTGLYISIKASNISIVFYPAKIVISSINKTAISTTSTTATARTGSSTSTSTSIPIAVSSPSGGLPITTIALVVAAVAIATSIVLIARRRIDRCSDLGDTDKLILRTLEEEGGRMPRAELARRLGLPASTLHKHLHKLSRYGYLRLVSEGGVQRVELLRRCSDG